MYNNSEQESALKSDNKVTKSWLVLSSSLASTSQTLSRSTLQHAQIYNRNIQKSQFFETNCT